MPRLTALLARLRPRLTDARGATLVEYALVTALVTVASIAAVQMLADSGETLLNDVGDDISTPRPYENVAIETPLTPPPAWATTTLPPGILTWVERPLATTEGCLSQIGNDIVIVACTDAAATLTNGLSEDGEVVTISTVDGTQCLTGDNTGPSPVVTIQTCVAADTGQQWRETGISGNSVTYEHEGSGLCLQTIVPAAPAPLTLAACDGSAGQMIEVRF